MLIQFRNEHCPIGGQIPGPERLFRSARSTTGDVDQNHRLMVATERVGEGGGVLEDLFDRVRGWDLTMPFCKSTTMRAVLGSMVETGIMLRNLQHLDAVGM